MQRPAPKLESPMHDESGGYKASRLGRPAPKLESPVYDESGPHKPPRPNDENDAPTPLGMPPRAPVAEMPLGGALPPRPSSRADPGQPPGTPSGLLGRVGSAALVNKQSRPPGFPPRPEEGRLARASSFNSFSRDNSHSRGSSLNSRQSAVSSAGSRGASPGFFFPVPARCREQGVAGLASRPTSAVRTVLQSLYY